MITLPSTATSTAAYSNGAGTTAAPILASDFETFLQMLTTQAKYQDPLEPMDSSEYAAQLAQFSMVEQQVLSNDLLSALAVQLGSGSMAQMAGWIGMEARTTAPVEFDGSPVTLYPNPVAVADEVILVVYDENGAEVQRASLPVSADPVEWAGVADDGSPFPKGIYSFEIENRAEGELLITDLAESYARVTETRMQNGQSVLILKGGSAVLADSVAALREPAI
ncbi:MAG: flagellar hook capping FlgD N-terminal domain-containing protein [Sulfitobacter sp.]